MGGNMGGTVQRSITQKFEKVTKIALLIKFHECSCHRIKRKLLSKYCYMGLRMHPSFSISSEMSIISSIQTIFLAIIIKN